MKTTFAVIVVTFAMLAQLANAMSPAGYVRAGDYDQAFKELERTVGPRASNEHLYQFLGALIELREQRTEEAQRLLRQILEAHPKFDTAREILFRSLAQSGNRDAALYHARYFAKNAVHPARRSAYIGYIEDVREHGLSFRFALQPSTNSNRGTSTQTVTVAGIPLTVSEASQARADIAATVGVTGWTTHRFSESQSLRSELRLDAVRYRDSQADNQFTLGFSSKINWSGPTSLASVGPDVSVTHKYDDVYQRSLGLVGHLRFDLNERSRLSFGLSHHRLRFPNHDYANGTRTRLSTQLDRRLNDGLSVAAGLSLEGRRADAPHNGYDRVSLWGGAEKRWDNGLNLGTSLRLSRQRHEDVFPGTTIYRQDDSANLSVSISSGKVHVFGQSPVLSITRSITASSIDLHENNAVDLGLSFTKQF